MQRGQAPCGELKEKMRGSSSGIEMPQCRQAKRSEKVWISGSPSLRHRLDLEDAVRERDGRLHRVGQALARVRLHHEAVDHHRDVVLELLVEDDLLLEQADLRRPPSRA